MFLFERCMLGLNTAKNGADNPVVPVLPHIPVCFRKIQYLAARMRCFAVDAEDIQLLMIL